MRDFDKPSQHEDEYFAREDIEKKRKLALEQAQELAASEREELKTLHYMKCPKCGMDLQTLDNGQRRDRHLLQLPRHLAGRGRARAARARRRARAQRHGDAAHPQPGSSAASRRAMKLTRRAGAPRGGAGAARSSRPRRSSATPSSSPPSSTRWRAAGAGHLRRGAHLARRARRQRCCARTWCSRRCRRRRRWPNAPAKVGTQLRGARRSSE